MKYNTSQPKLILPQYGRHIQKLINYCLSIEDKEERTKCAYAIAELMMSVFENNSEEEEMKIKIWDHINMISNFKLDIDFPYEVMEEEQMNPVPSRIPYRKTINNFRHYGRNVQEMINLIAEMENGTDKDNLIFLVANQMKKQLITHNPELATDMRVFNDISIISNGRISIDPDSYRLNDYIGIASPDNNRKKKKK